MAEGWEHYLRRMPRPGPDEASLPLPGSGVKLAVVIPSLAERESLGDVLGSLAAGSLRLSEVEVLVVVNQPEGAGPETAENNLQTLRELPGLAPAGLAVHALDRASPGRALPVKSAGVGLARKVGMDAALRRLVQAGAGPRAVIACLDADSPAAPGYPDALLEFFESNRDALGGICEYAHLFSNRPRLALAGVVYELWLRYYELGLGCARSRFAFPTIGSTLAVTAGGYALAGGMPPRKAGEDFHFLRNLAKLGGAQPIGRIRKAVVYPRARLSDRVPFGTGRAMRVCLEEGMDRYLYAEPPDVFFEIGDFFQALLPGFQEPEYLENSASPRLRNWLTRAGAWEVFKKFRAVYPDPEHFSMAVQHWLDSLEIVRYANRVKREEGGTWIFDALRRLAEKMGTAGRLDGLPRVGPGDLSLENARAWLDRLRTFSER